LILILDYSNITCISDTQAVTWNEAGCNWEKFLFGASLWISIGLWDYYLGNIVLELEFEGKQ
jgi:hypothetical protein